MKLVGRAELLHAMGVLGPGEKTWRAGWSHDDGEYIYFDAWTNKYVDGLYPMCTDKEYIRPNEQGEVRNIDRATGEVTGWGRPRPGHVRWLHHLDLCIQGQRTPVLINPEPKVPGVRQGDAGAAGWRPQYSLGRLTQDDAGHWWIKPDRTIAVDTAVDPTARPEHWEAVLDFNDVEDGAANGDDDPVATAAEMIERHIAESQEMLRRLKQKGG